MGAYLTSTNVANTMYARTLDAAPMKAERKSRRANIVRLQATTAELLAVAGPWIGAHRGELGPAGRDLGKVRQESAECSPTAD